MTKQNTCPEEIKEILAWATKFRVLVIIDKSKNRFKFYLDKEENNFESIQLVPPILIEYAFGKGFNKLAESEFERIFKEIGFKKIAKIYL